MTEIYYEQEQRFELLLGGYDEWALGDLDLQMYMDDGQILMSGI